MSGFPFPGLNLALATPFKDDGAIDFARLEANLERYIAVGVKGFVLSSGTGMHVYLSEEESNQLIQRGAKIINGRAKVIAQTSALLTGDVVRRTKFAKDVGADGVMVLPPFFEGPTDDDDIVDFYSRVGEAGLPIIGYNVPHVVGVAITPTLLGKLNKIPNFLTVKDSSGDMGKQADLIATGHYMMNGADTLAAAALYTGCHGLIWGGANFAPKTCLAIAEAGMAKDWKKLNEVWQPLQRAMSFIWAGDYVKKVYAAAEMMGYGAGIPRRPLSALAQDRLLEVRHAIEELVERERL
jgi:4-hydroxy-tetrahydrodipicolinate synthase